MSSLSVDSPLETLQRRTSRRRQCGGVIVVVHQNGPGKSLDGWRLMTGKSPYLEDWFPVNVRIVRITPVYKPWMAIWKSHHQRKQTMVINHLLIGMTLQVPFHLRLQSPQTKQLAPTNPSVSGAMLVSGRIVPRFVMAGLKGNQWWLKWICWMKMMKILPKIFGSSNNSLRILKKLKQG